MAVPTIDHFDLAKQRCDKLFAALDDDIGAVVSCNTNNKDYVGGYHSMTHDISPGYQSAVVATRDKILLVVGAADAGPALEVLKDPTLLFRYGVFFFESHESIGDLGFDRPDHPDFGTALAAALASAVPNGAKVGVDPSPNGALERLVGDRYGVGAIVDVGDQILAARRFKLPGEIALIRRATELVEAGLESIVAEGRVGMTEHDFAALVGRTMMAGGAVPRLVSVTSGPRSALADAYPTFRVIEPGDLVRVDASCWIGPFSSDMARTFVMGEPSPLIAKLYKAIELGLEEELAAVKNGVRAGDIFATAVETVRKAGIPTYRRQHCGHGLGIGGYESPIIAGNSDLVIEAGMCFCLETPYYQLGWGGMMVEDTIVVTEDGYEPITTIPRKLFVL